MMQKGLFFPSHTAQAAYLASAEEGQSLLLAGDGHLYAVFAAEEAREAEEGATVAKEDLETKARLARRAVAGLLRAD